ncbi:MAG: hypothetical protein A3G21_13190 [Acidobacteria bacterium RIFCSPLOWO2_12_FULL_66_21]|nr:MAG: hypothetical protein A3G21_13190 [Acidobacteria bacterium RIFCSPLOWO2_12_FULL_66_21]
MLRLLSDKARADPQVCLVSIVRTAKLEIADGHLTAIGERNQVMGPQEPTFRASALGAHECTATLVAFPHLPFDCRGDVT